MPIGVIHDEGGAQTELTKVIPAAATGPMATIDDVDNAAQLRLMTKRRARRGGWLIALVILLAALAALVGWWFGSGPGSMVMVPDVAKMTFADAQAVLAKESLTGVQKDVFDFDVPAGTTVGSEPGAGLPVDKDSTVTVLVSKGPQDHAIPALGGLPADQARATLEAALVRSATMCCSSRMPRRTP